MAKRGADPAQRTGPVRCAVYTRKSTEEGLEQTYNSLDAQHDACAAYVASQRHERWTLLPTRYDDGGYSGGSLERPGLKRLLADVAAGKVDVIVIYKVDRLTRALSDFAKIVEVLDGAGASFVSVTQSFNTTTSMGRLTLNMLLSFAQFEREVTGERIRDKIAASKKKGLWMGGVVPLGYDVRDRKLVVNDSEADLVRHIYQRYLALGTGRLLVDELREEGHRTKQRQLADGRVYGGIPFTRGMLFNLLKNRIYLGEIVHRGTAHPGEHQAIVTLELFAAVQQRIAAARVERRVAHNTRSPGVLIGRLKDGLGRRMTSDHASKAGRRYRYYVTHQNELRPDGPPAWQLPARPLEQIVTARLVELLRDPTELRSALSTADADALATSLTRAARAADELESRPDRRGDIASLIAGVQVGETSVSIDVDRNTLRVQLGLLELDGAAPLLVTAPAVRVRRGKAVRLVFASEQGRARQVDAKLVALLGEARGARDAMLANPSWTVRDAAAAQGKCRFRLAQLIRLSFLAPDIVGAIVDGRQPIALAAHDLLGQPLPLDWAAQRAMLNLG